MEKVRGRNGRIWGQRWNLGSDEHRQQHERAEDSAGSALADHETCSRHWAPGERGQLAGEPGPLPLPQPSVNRRLNSNMQMFHCFFSSGIAAAA